VLLGLKILVLTKLIMLVGDNDFTWTLLDKVQEIATELNATMSQVSLRWVMQKKTTTSTLIGARTIEQLEENLSASKIVLSDEHMRVLDELSKVEADYPYHDYRSLIRAPK